MGFAEVAVEAPATRQTFSYSVPKGLKVMPGQLVWVPFGSRLLQGIVFQLAVTPSFEPTRDIVGAVDSTPILSPLQLALASWLSQYYMCPLFTSASLMLPPGFRQRIFTYFSVSRSTETPSKPLTRSQGLLLRYIERRDRVELRQLERAFKRIPVASVTSQLVRRGLLLRSDALARPRVSPKTNRFVRIVASPVDLAKSLEKLPGWSRASKQADLLEYLATSGSRPSSDLKALPFGGSSVISSLARKELAIVRGVGKVVDLLVSPAEALDRASEMRRTKKAEQLSLALRMEGRSAAGVEDRLTLSGVLKLTGATGDDVQILSAAGLVEIEEEEAYRDPLARRALLHPVPTHGPELTLAQETIWREIENSMPEGEAEARVGVLPSVFLLHGVTGSGKTEIYLRALSRVARAGRHALVLVPEIALTPQTVGRFQSRFPGRVAVLHSKLSEGEQYDEWRRIWAGEFDVVIGSRSSIFAPMPDLGLIVLDEEHEWTYKQVDVEPRYHAREVALKLAELSGAAVILGSATPDVADYFRCRAGGFKLVELHERVASSGWAVEPVESSPGRLSTVDVVDLRQELRAGNRSIFSRALLKAMTVALAAREQIILFLNRRGTSTFVICRDCGFVLRCKRCDVAMTYHSAEDDMVCHLCNYRATAPEVCPNCWSHRIRYLGVGTEKLEEETRKAFPEARVLRWDRDTARRKGAHEQILDRFTAHEADILIGTQMIAKGLDLPSVTLVGVICADIGLHLPDYRSGEHTFQLLTQVVGRAGRGVLGGRAIIQTYSPDHYAVVAASRQDYGAFYRREIDFRREQENPPFSQLAKLVFTGASDEKCEKEARRVSGLLREAIRVEATYDFSLIGPAPAYIRRLRGRYRWQIIVRGTDLQRLLSRIPLPAGWVVDIDPVSLL